MPPLKPVKGRKVWRVCVDAKHWNVVTNDKTLIALYDGKLFTTKDVADRFAFKAVLQFPEYIGVMVVDEYVCTGDEDLVGTMYLMNPPLRRRRGHVVRKRRRIKSLWTP